MEKLFRETVRHYPTVRRSFLQLTVGSVRLRGERGEPWAGELALTLRLRHNSDCYYQTIIVRNYLSAPVDADFLADAAARFAEESDSVRINQRPESVRRRPLRRIDSGRLPPVIRVKQTHLRFESGRPACPDKSPRSMWAQASRYSIFFTLRWRLPPDA